MNTIENNILIAEFLGWEIKSYSTPIKDIVTPYGQITENNLKFHNDWNWLMEAVEKIYNLDIYYDKYIEYNSSMFSDGKIELSTSINKVYEQVIEFITWYNSAKKE